MLSRIFSTFDSISMGHKFPDSSVYHDLFSYHLDRVKPVPVQVGPNESFRLDPAQLAKVIIAKNTIRICRKYMSVASIDINIMYPLIPPRYRDVAIARNPWNAPPRDSATSSVGCSIPLATELYFPHSGQTLVLIPDSE